MDNADMPAMPLTGDAYLDLNGSANTAGRIEDGMGLSKREHFAAMAMQGFIAAGVNGMPSRHDLALLSVEYADALLTELDKE